MIEQSTLLPTYYRFLNLSVDEKLAKALQMVSYKKIFILDSLPLKNDYARSEDEQAQKYS